MEPKQFAETIGVQGSAWGFEDAATVPAHLMIAAQEHSGLVLGAYDGRRMVGVLFGFTALQGSRPYHYSHITGVVKEYQSRGVGFRLKLAQRKFVIGQGQRLVRWTYDPLQAGNAFFNIGKLGAVCRVYQRNLYGSLDDSLNRGRVTDRFEVDWWVRSSRVMDRVVGRERPRTLEQALSAGAVFVNMTVSVGPGVRRVESASLGLKKKLLLVEIPESIVKVAAASGMLAKGWTLHLRRIFESYFRKGYSVVDVVVERTEDVRRVFYLLEQDFQAR